MPTPADTPDSLKDAAKIPAGILDVLIKPATLSAQALSAVAKGGISFNSAMQSTGDMFTKLGTVTGFAGDGLKIFGEYAQESVDAMRNFSKVGAGFSGDAIGMRASIAQTNMSLEQYSKFLNTNSTLLNGMGGTVSQGAKSFNLFSAEFFAATGKTNKEFGTFGDQLRNLGMNSEEINGVLALELTSRRFTSMQDQAAKDAAIKSAYELAEEMDKTSKLSGKSREEQLKSLTALERDGKYQAAIRLEMMSGNKFAKEGLDTTMAKIEKFGPGVQNLVKDIVSFGTASKDSLGTLVALGPAGTQLQNAVNMTKTARTEEQKQAAANAVAAAERSISAELVNERFLANARFGIKGFQDLANATTTNAAAMDKIAAEHGLNLNIEIDRRKANQLLADQAKKEQTDAKKPAEAGAEDRGKATTQMVVQFESSLQKASAAINESFIKKLNEDVAGPMANFARDLQNIPLATYAKSIETAYKELENKFTKKTSEDPNIAAREESAIRVKGQQAAMAAAAAAKAAGFGTEDQDKQAEIARRAAEREEQENQRRQRLNREVPAPAAGSNPLSSITPGLFTTTPGVITGTVDVNARAMAIGGIVEKPELILAGEAGPEAIFNQSQLENYTAKVMGSAAGAMPKIDLSGISKSISTSVSSVSGGGSTTTRRVQNDDSKSAEKELEVLKEVHLAEKRKLVNQLREEGLVKGKQANSGDMKRIPQLAALKEKQDSEQAVLSKRVDAGTSRETVSEEAKAETIKLIDEQIAITKAGNSTIADVYRNNSKSKLDLAKQDTESLDDLYEDDSKAKLDLAKQRNEALFKAAELAKDVVGTSVKDMSDSMFESMIPKGAKITDYYEDMNGKLQSYSADTVAKMEKNAKDSANVVESYSTTVSLSSKKMAGDIAGALPSTTTKQLPKPEELAALMPKPEAISGIFSNLFNNIPKPEELAALMPKPEELNALMPKPEAISGIFSNLFNNIPKTEELNALMPKPEAISGIFSNLFNNIPKSEELAALLPKPEAMSGIFSNLFNNIPKPEELNALMPKPEAISGIFSNLFNNIPKPEELNALMPKPEAISGIFSNLFKTVPKLAATAEQKVDPNQADNDDAEMGAAIRANDVAGKSISAAPIEIDNPEASMGAGKYSPVKPNATLVAGKDPFARMLDRFMGPMAEPGKALAPAEAAKTAITAQNEAAAKSKAGSEENVFDPTGNKGAPKSKTDSKTGSKESTLSDVVKSLDTLNMQVGQLAGEMSRLPSLMEKAVSATKALNGNLNMRVT